MRIYGEKVKVQYPQGFGDISQGPQKIVLKKRNVQVRIDKEPIPLHDYINFKKMSGNEIILNLDNVLNLRNGELVSGLCELAQRDKNKEFDWNTHPVTFRCLNELKRRATQLNHKQVIMLALLLQNLRIIDQDIWNLAATNSLKLLHKYSGSQLAQLLDLFDKDILDDEGEPHALRKTDDTYFERIVGIIPIHIKTLRKECVTRLLEILVKKNLGSERIYRDYLLLTVEKNIMYFNTDQYSRILRALADKNYVEDSIFWNQFIFKYVHEDAKKQPREFVEAQARKIWDSLVYLKLKCPTLDVQPHINRVESFIPREDTYTDRLTSGDAAQASL
eukprot:403367729